MRTSLENIPENIDIEHAVLAACIMQPDILAACSETLKEEYLRGPSHALIWSKMVKMFLEGKSVTVATLASEFNDKKYHDYIQSVADMSFFRQTPEQVETEYVSKLRNLWKLREILHMTAMMHDAACSGETANAEELIGDLEAFANKLQGHEENTGPSLDGWGEALNQIQAAMTLGRAPGILTGFAGLDNIIGGMANSNMIVLGGRTSMGKTSLALNIAENVANAGHNVYFASLEMGREQLNLKRQSALTGIDSNRMLQGQITPEEMRKLTTLQDNKRIYVDQTARLPIDTLISRCRRMKKMNGLGLVIVDYLQLLDAPAEYRREGMVSRVTQISNRLKMLAKDLQIPVLALAQLNRETDKDSDGRPRLVDLKDSGAIEQDADVVMFCYRAEYYLSRTTITRFDRESEANFQKRQAEHEYKLQQSKGIAEVIVAKNRHGPIGNVHMKFIGETTTFKE